jgi:HSP20 family molecular chaperone IbpA
MIMGEGLVAKSGILLVDYANTLRERGVGRTEALQEAVRLRLRPILMTSATMIFGMMPLALKLEPGAETRAPMAIVVIGALLSSTLLTLVIVPALYTVMDDLQTRLFGAPRRPWETPPAPAAVPHPATPPVAVANGHGTQVQPHAPGVPLNVHDYGDAYLVRAALPGIKQEDVDVSIQGHTLSIRGERRGEANANGHSNGNGHVVVQEYDTGSWERSMVLPQEVERDGVTAHYEDGILELRLPKSAASSVRRVPIDGPMQT